MKSTKQAAKSPRKAAAKARSSSILESLRAEGELHRKQLPRADLAQWNPKLRRRTPSELLDASMQGRLSELFPLKRQRMSASPFGFFRGAVPVMAYDLSLTPNTGILAQLCGDAHVQNLGAFCGIADALIFDINDFDETVRGPFEFDIKRMATSILLAAGTAKIKHAPAVQAAEVFLDSYTGMIRRLAAMPVLEVARFQVHRLATVRPISKILFQAEHETPGVSLERLTENTASGRVFKTVPAPGGPASPAACHPG